jgi:hypothetical protein
MALWDETAEAHNIPRVIADDDDERPSTPDTGLTADLDVERLAEALDALDDHWFEDALHGASSWNMAQAILARLTEADR